MKLKSKHLLIGDYFIIGIIVILSALIFIFMLPKSKDNNIVEIYVNN